MRHRRSVSSGGLFLLAACATTWQAACSSDGTPTSSLPLSSQVVSDDQPTPAGPTLDALFLEVGKEVPGFAGLVLGSDGQLIIKLVDTTDGPKAREQVARVFGGAPNLAGRTTRLEVVRYSFAEIISWREALYAKDLPSGIRLIDADEGRNALRIGVADEAGVNSVRSFVRSLGVPDSGVVIDVVQTVRPLADSVGNYYRPVVGGLRVGLWTGAGTTNYCSLGFKAKKTTSTRYIVTNSHCTATFGSVDGDSLGQPNYNYWIANEVQDPGFGSTGCYSGYTCRMSDAALIQCSSGSTCANYTLARTTSEYTGSDWANGSGSLQLYTDDWYVVGEISNSSLIQGASVSKVGATTGWTGGTIQQTCFSVLGYPVTGKELKCQFSSLAVVRSGDSGSPVFQYEASTGKAWLAGVVWGLIYPDHWESVFSPLDGIKTDIGAMTVSSLIF